MARKQIDIGTVGNDGTGDSIRESFRKVNDNFSELYSSLGLGENLKFINLDGAPVSGWLGKIDENRPDETYLVTTDSDNSEALAFKRLRAGQAISIDWVENDIFINSAFGGVQQDTSPRLGGDLRVGGAGGEPPFKILELGVPEDPDEAVNKAYADSKISLAGVNGVDPASGVANAAFGRMTGPLILSRNPEQADDDTFGGLIASTKNYVDQRASISEVNLYVSTSGEDERVGVDSDVQGRSLALAYRSIEAALRRAEEILQESPLEIGPYEKLLTYDNGKESAVLRSIVKSPDDQGTGFVGSALLSVDTVSLTAAGDRYYPGDILEVVGGNIPAGGGRATIRVLSTLTTPGPIASFRIVSVGVYDGALPDVTNAQVSVLTSAAPPGITARGIGARFDLTFKVGGVNIVDPGQNYGLVSVRITGGGGTGAFGVANVSNSQIASISITDAGSGFTSFPSVEVDLPRFVIFTDGKRTDFSGFGDGVQLSSSQDLRPGLFIKGRTSGALAQILTYTRELVNDDGVLPDENQPNEFFDVDIKFGQFIVGEELTYGDSTKSKQLTVLVESGVYEENLPLKIPQNVAVLGDEFRRCLVRPKRNISSSPWAFVKFRRDPLVDGINTATGRREDFDDTPLSDLYGYHYLTDPSKPVYPKINNRGEYNSAATLMKLNKQFIQEEVIAWTNYQIENNISPYSAGFEYNEQLCKRDVGLIVDAIVFDLRNGEYNRTVSAALKYYQRPSMLGSGLIAIRDQQEETVASIRKIYNLAQSILANAEVPEVFNTVESQIIDNSFISEVFPGGSAINIVENLIDIVVDIIIPEEERINEVNFPKPNDELDVFLCNDAVILRRISSQGHGGFMMVLDPEGQILAKSPYAQECSSFSKSVNDQYFAGGQYVDGFAGNLQFLHDEYLRDPTTNEIIPNRIRVSGLGRFPRLPASVIIDSNVYRINYVRNFEYDPDGSTADFELDINTPWDRDEGAQDVEIIESTETPGVFIFERENHRLQAGSILQFTSSGDLPTGIELGRQYFVLPGATNNTFQVSLSFGGRSPIELSNDGTGQLQYQRLYEVLMPGNRSMLGNDFTQINDLGYGIVAANGGLIEAVSMFSYYCHISMYSLTGGQIRSIGGSSAHGNFALVAEGSDPLELPTPTALYHDLSQTARAFSNPAAGLVNDQDTLVLYVYKYDYVPLPGSEIEIIHTIGGLDTVALYTISQASFADETSFPGVVKIDLVPSPIAGQEGLLQSVSLDQLVTIRQRGEIVLTNNLVGVAVRPSTGLVLAEQTFVVTDEAGQPLNDNGSVVVPYRVLSFDGYQEFDEPFDIRLTPSNNSFSLITTIVSINNNIATTEKNHKLKINDKFVPDITDNGLTAGVTYYVVDIPEYDQFRLSTSPSGSAVSLSNGTGLSITGIKSHRFRENFLIRIIAKPTADPEISLVPVLADDSLLDTTVTYFVLSETNDLTDSDIEFQLSDTIGGDLLEFSLTQDETPAEFLFRVSGLTRTTLREDYNFVRLGVFTPGEFRETPVNIDTVENQEVVGVESAVFTTLTAHGFQVGDIIGITTKESSDRLPGGIRTANYYILATPSASTFTISLSPGGQPIILVGTDDGSKFGNDSWQTAKINGIIGDDNFAVQSVSPSERVRLIGSTFVFAGTEYKITEFDPPSITGEPYARVTLNRPLTANIVGFASPYTIAAGVTAGTVGAEGSLTIRISLTRVTGHDMLAIGTGSYADTNYPSEIFGPPVNPIQDANETVERDVGRVFFVSTDQFGNFKVGRNFTVDQGTGEVKISANISLSNIAGFQFRRGVAVSEFSNDDRFLSADSNVVATSLATLTYISRRLGVDVRGELLDPNSIEPADGGFMALSGVATMKGNMQLGNNKIVGLADPEGGQDAANLRSLTYDNFQNFTGTDVSASDLIVFTGVGNESVNAATAGDVTFELSGNTYTSSISDNVIIDSDVNTDAAIAQSKLAMQAATTRANATGIAQSDLGLASFNNLEFEATDGWINLKDNGTSISKIQKIASNTVLGNSSALLGNTLEIPFATVVNQGLGIKKSQYNSLGFLRRTNTGTTEDSAWTVVEMDTAATNNRLVVRDGVDGGFSAGTVNFTRTNISSRIDLNNKILFNADSDTVRLYGDDGNAGIRIQTGSTNLTSYRNAVHRFRNSAGTQDAPIIASSVQTLALTTGSNTTSGTITGRWTLTGNSPNESRLQATYSADLAEYYEGDKEYPVGTVLVFGGDKEVTSTNVFMDTRVAGVVSNTAAFVMYDACPGYKNLVALQGRVPCKVVGKIQKGDMLVTASIPGIAIAAKDVKVGTVVGKALESYDSDHIGTIEIAVGRT